MFVPQLLGHGKVTLADPGSKLVVHNSANWTSRDDLHLLLFDAEYDLA
jgi:hypothetical protein